MHRLLSSFFLVILSLSLLAVVGTANAGAKDPLQVIVSLSDQTLRVFKGTSEIISSNISSGKKGHDTPTGIFSILQKNRHHRSNIYANAPMPFMQRLTWSGIALHASNSVPRYPVSHGCVRMPHSFARELFKMRTNGMHVVIEENPDTPQSIEHPFLFQPIKTWEPGKMHDRWVNEHISHTNRHLTKPDHRYPARIFITRRTYKDDLFEVQRLLNKLGHDAGKIDGLMGPATWKAVKQFQSDSGLKTSGKIDNPLLDQLYKHANETRPANGRLMIRKHHQTIFETQIHIKDPEIPLGSHLLTVMNFDARQNSTGWTALSIVDRVQQTIHLDREKTVDPETRRLDAGQTLSRIEMSNLDHELISRHLSPGSSITVSDNGMSVETGARGTDFIVLTKPEYALSEHASNQTN